MQPFVAVLSNSVYALLVTLKLCNKVTKHYEMRLAQSPVIVTLPGTEAHDAERRRFAAAVACSVSMLDLVLLLFFLLVQLVKCANISRNKQVRVMVNVKCEQKIVESWFRICHEICDWKSLTILGVSWSKFPGPLSHRIS